MPNRPERQAVTPVSQNSGGVFESVPERSVADASHASQNSGAGVFESVPQPSVADASADRQLPPFLDVNGPIVFVNEPLLSTADTSESKPMVDMTENVESKVLHTVDSLATDDVCPICQGDGNEDVVELLCGGGHRFHRECIGEWLRMRKMREYKRFCPLCAGEEIPTPTTQPRMALHGTFTNAPVQSAAHRRAMSPDASPAASDEDVSGTWESMPHREIFNYAVNVQDEGVFENVPISRPVDASSLRPRIRTPSPFQLRFATT